MRQLVISKSITQRDYKSLDKYFNEIDKIDLISTREEVMLARRIREGDKAALERLTKTNLRFVVSVAKQYQNMGLTLGDLINEGNMGLIIAAKRYDETKGFKFISYAVWWIRQSISNALAEHARMVRLPYNQLIFLNKMHKIQSTLEQKHGRKPSDDELAECMELPVEKIKDMMNKSGTSISIDEAFQDDDNYTLLDILPDSDASTDYLVEQEAIAREIHYSMKVLSKRDRELLGMFFGLGGFSPVSLEEIGKRFNISKEHVGRLKEKALIKLRNCSNAQVLMSCLS
jgi:RNA polymerase primary sigma factor